MKKAAMLILNSPMAHAIRITGKISKRLKIKPAKQEQEQESTGKLGNWYVNYLIFGRQHLVIAVSEKSLLPVLVTAKNLIDFPIRLREQLGSILNHLGVENSAIKEELLHMHDWTFSKTSNRMVIGMMVDFDRLLEYHEPYHFMEDALIKTSLKLAHTPCSPLEYDPETEVKKIFQVDKPKIIPIQPYLKHRLELPPVFVDCVNLAIYEGVRNGQKSIFQRV